MQVIRLHKFALSILLFFMVTVIFLFRLIYISNTTQIKLLPTDLLQSKKSSQESDSELDDEFLVNTFGCKMTRLPVMTSKIREFFKPPDRIICLPPAITKSNESYLWINLDNEQLQKFYNIAEYNLLSCHYQPFERISDRMSFTSSAIGQLSYGEKYLISDEFIRVQCFYGFKTVYLEYHSFLPEKPEVLKRVQRQILNNSEKTQEDKLNVMILGIDTLSRLNFHRTMKKSKRTLEKLGGIEFFGYNKVADNTYPNLIPLLTGLNVSEFEIECIPYEYFDNCHFIWKDYEKKGYQTIFGEDCGYIAAFTTDKPGFDKQPTDYFLNTVIIEMEENIARNKKGYFYMCLGDKKPNEVLFKYIEKLIKTKHNEKFFSLFWTSTMTHEFINYPTLIDDDLSDLLIKIKDEGYLNKTVLVLLSDHGIRYGDFRETNQGMIEERQPLLYFILPKWFKQSYPEAHKNLMINRQRLTTPFDIYETMQDLLKPELLKSSSIQMRSKELFEKSILPRATSLFLQVSPNRTCETAGIESHWCTCFERKEISISDDHTQKAATFVVKYINDLLKNYTKCIKLSLNSILFANLEANSDNFNVNIEKTQTLYDLIIGIEVKPSLAKFEATVRFPEDGSDKLQILGTISRINKYGNQSHCINDHKLKLYCFCIT